MRFCIVGEARDALINLIMKNCPYDQLDWAEKMLKTDAYHRLMEVASELNMEEFRYQYISHKFYGAASCICVSGSRQTPSTGSWRWPVSSTWRSSGTVTDCVAEPHHFYAVPAQDGCLSQAHGGTGSQLAYQGGV
jgi:hypothetical protein